MIRKFMSYLQNLVVVRMGDSAYSSQYAVTVFLIMNCGPILTVYHSTRHHSTKSIQTSIHGFIPTKNNFLQLDSETSTYFIYNIQGRCCLQSKSPDAQRKLIFQCFKEGSYYLKIQTKNNQWWYFKFIEKNKTTICHRFVLRKMIFQKHL